MQERRILRLEDIFKKELNTLINQETNFDPGILITITSVKISKDLQWANVFVSIYPFNKHEIVLNHLIAIAGQFQHQINKIINIKHTPKIVFKLDNHFEDIDNKIKLIESGTKNLK
jgi:ribosome-binding factor A